MFQFQDFPHTCRLESLQREKLIQIRSYTFGKIRACNRVGKAMQELSKQTMTNFPRA